MSDFSRENVPLTVVRDPVERLRLDMMGEDRQVWVPRSLALRQRAYLHRCNAQLAGSDFSEQPFDTRDDEDFTAALVVAAMRGIRDMELEDDVVYDVHTGSLIGVLSHREEAT